MEGDEGQRVTVGVKCLDAAWKEDPTPDRLRIG